MKKTICLLLILLSLSSCVEWLENDQVYERKLNKWISIQYRVGDDNARDQYLDFYLSNNSAKDIGKRAKVNKNNKENKQPLVPKCIKIVYNDYYLLAKAEEYVVDPYHSLSYKYYKITPIFTPYNTLNGYTTDTISEASFNTSFLKCKDCTETYAETILEMDSKLSYEQFFAYKIKFVFLAILIVIFAVYAIRKKKQQPSKPQHPTPKQAIGSDKMS